MTWKRSLWKTITWRLIATVITMGATLVLTGRVDLAASVGVLDAVLKLGAYFLHERAWDRWGQL